MKKNCTAGNYQCTQEIEVKDNLNGLKITFYQDKTLAIGEYQYTVQQAEKSTSFKKDKYLITKVGNVLTFSSLDHGFFINYDNEMNIKVGLSTEKVALNSVNGLCGLYNSYKLDDKTKPNGVLADSTEDFGDSWNNGDLSVEDCREQSCPRHLQIAAFEMCNAVRGKTFLPCQSVVDVDSFVASCIENACSCMKIELHDKPMNHSAADAVVSDCECSLYQSFVSECLAIKEDVVLKNWRTAEGCPSSCPPTQVPVDCYRYRCQKNL